MNTRGPAIILVYNDHVMYLTLNKRQVILLGVLIALAISLIFLNSTGGEDSGINGSSTTTILSNSSVPEDSETTTTQQGATIPPQTTTIEKITTTTTISTTTTTTLKDYSKLEKTVKSYHINSNKCDGWSENPCGNPDHMADYNGDPLTCDLDDSLSSDKGIYEITITLIQLVGTTGDAEIEIKLNNNTLGELKGNTNCDSDGPRSWTIKYPDYTPGETNTITVKNIGPSGWATIGDEEGPSTMLFKINVTYVTPIKYNPGPNQQTTTTLENHPISNPKEPVSTPTTIASTTKWKGNINARFSSNPTYWRYSIWDLDHGEAKPTGNWLTEGGVDNSPRVDISISRDKSVGVGGYWMQEFTSEKAATEAICKLKWKMEEYSDDPKELRVYAFIDKDDKDPVIGSEIFDSGLIKSTTDWSNDIIDCKEKIHGKGTYFYKIAVWMDTDGSMRGPYKILFDDSAVIWME